MERPIFDDPSLPVAAALSAWSEASPPFAAFVAANRDKIRKKVKGASDAAALEDVHFELSVASSLLRDRRCALLYEPRVPGRSRAPDFALTFRVSTTLMLEATRLRPAPTPSGGHAAARLQALVCAKLGQLVPQATNVIVVGVAGSELRAVDVAATLRRLQLRVEKGEPALLARYGFRDPADFFKHHRRLSAVVTRPWPPDHSETVLWSNGQATHPTAPKVAAVLLA